MKAGIVFANEDIRYADMPLPEVPAGHVRVKVKVCGICGSDIPRVLANGAHNYPVVLGHEFSGVIESIGAEVDDLAVGDHVSGIPLVPCMKCEYCMRGDYALCGHYSFIGSRQQGAMAEYVVVPARNVLKIDKSIPFEHAAMFEPCTVAMHGILMTGFDPALTYGILGGGTIGLFALQILKALGAEKVFVIGRNKKRLELSREHGADGVFSVLDADHKAQIMAATDGRGIDVLYEIAGAVDAMKLAFEIAAKKAKLCFIGTPKEDLVFSPKLFEHMNRKEFTLTGGWMSYSAPFPGKEWTETERLFAEKKVGVSESMIYRRYPLREIRAAFEEFRHPENVKGKILIINE